MPGVDNFDFEYAFEGEFEEDDEDEDEDKDEIVVPLRNMRQWTENKSRWFGEGKLYDTSIEDKLMEELEQSRVAQLANVTNLKNNPEDGNPNFKKGKLPKQKVVCTWIFKLLRMVKLISGISRTINWLDQFHLKSGVKNGLK